MSLDKSKTLKGNLDHAIDLFQKGAHEEAHNIFRDLIVIAPQTEMAWSGLGAVLRKLQKYDAAVTAQKHAHNLAPNSLSIKSNLVNALNNAGRYSEALPLAQKNFLANKGDVSFVKAYVKCLKGNCQAELAVEIVDAFVAEFGNDAELAVDVSLARLYLGQFTKGFEDFEQRFESGEVALNKKIEAKRWRGEDLGGKDVLVFKEQGFGDNIWFSRFLPALHREAGVVHMATQRPLLRLMSKFNGIDKLLEMNQINLDDYDYVLPICSLPKATKFSDKAPKPSPQPLNIPDDSRKRARTMLGRYKDVKKVGIVWTGSLTYKSNHLRSVDIKRFLKLAEIPNVQLISLYKGDAIEDLKTSGAEGIILDACSTDRDFADTAAIIDELDLLITTDTGVVHVAANMGKPVWNMVTYEGFWMYGAGTRTPWYPSMRIFRQPAEFDWDSVFETIEMELRDFVAN